MKILKTFVRNGQRYRPGDALPADLDKQTVAHYTRLGMIGAATAAAEASTKPRARSKASTATRPQETKPLAPSGPPRIPGPGEGGQASPTEGVSDAPGEPGNGEGDTAGSDAKLPLGDTGTSV